MEHAVVLARITGMSKGVYYVFRSKETLSLGIIKILTIGKWSREHKRRVITAELCVGILLDLPTSYSLFAWLLRWSMPVIVSSARDQVKLWLVTESDEWKIDPFKFEQLSADLRSNIEGSPPPTQQTNLHNRDCLDLVTYLHADDDARQFKMLFNTFISKLFIIPCHKIHFA